MEMMDDDNYAGLLFHCDITPLIASYLDPKSFYCCIVACRNHRCDGKFVLSEVLLATTFLKLSSSTPKDSIVVKDTDPVDVKKRFLSLRSRTYIDKLAERRDDPTSQKRYQEGVEFMTSWLNDKEFKNNEQAPNQGDNDEPPPDSPPTTARTTTTKPPPTDDDYVTKLLHYVKNILHCAMAYDQCDNGAVTFQSIHYAVSHFRGGAAVFPTNHDRTFPLFFSQVRNESFVYIWRRAVTILDVLLVDLRVPMEDMKSFILRNIQEWKDDLEHSGEVEEFIEGEHYERAIEMSGLDGDADYDDADDNDDDAMEDMILDAADIGEQEPKPILERKRDMLHEFEQLENFVTSVRTLDDFGFMDRKRLQLPQWALNSDVCHPFANDGRMNLSFELDSDDPEPITRSALDYLQLIVEEIHFGKAWHMQLANGFDYYMVLGKGGSLFYACQPPEDALLLESGGIVDDMTSLSDDDSKWIDPDDEEDEEDDDSM